MMLKTGILVFITFVVFSVFSQDDKSNYFVSCIAFYNVENLFDTLDTKDVNDIDFTPEGSNKWNSERYYEKLDRLAEVIQLLGVDKTPDGAAVIGLAEVENRAVVFDLTQQERIKSRGYEIVHYDSPDKRGIDVAFLYQPKYFTVESSKTYTLKIEGNDNFYTRDQLLISGDFHGERMHFIIAHWPSRRGGEKKSSPMREAAADLARGVIDSILVAEGPQAKVILMGDLNDDPVSKSVRNNMRSVGSPAKVTEDKLFNPFEDLYKKGIGTLAWRDSWNLFDQHMLTPAFLMTDDKSTYHFYKAVVFNKPFLMQPDGRFKGYPLRSYAGGNYIGGYSDHFPTYFFIIKQVE
jgi:hypothetical protein